jgi:hypothetical protein
MNEKKEPLFPAMGNPWREYRELQDRVEELERIVEQLGYVVVARQAEAGLPAQVPYQVMEFKGIENPTPGHVSPDIGHTSEPNT